MFEVVQNTYFSNKSFLLQLLPPATKLEQGYVFTRVCGSVHHRVGGLPHCMLAYTPPLGPEAGIPQSETPPREQTPPRTRHPPAHCMLGDTGNKWAVRILLECNLVLILFSFTDIFWLHAKYFIHYLLLASCAFSKKSSTVNLKL